MTLRRVGLSNSLSSQAKISNKRFTLSRVSLRRFPFPTAAAAAIIPIYVEEVFSTYLYTGNGSTQTITNGIDLSGKGGMVWLKSRSADSHYIVDTARGSNKVLYSNLTIAEETLTRFSSFNSNGFSLSTTPSNPNVNGDNYASWTFRKQAKFFDVVTFTTSAAAAYTFNHNLGSTPGFVIIKSTSVGGAWYCYHTSLGVNKYLLLNTTDASGTNPSGNWAATSTTFTVPTDFLSGGTQTYVAYLFAHDAGGFGASGTDNVISCGSFTDNGAIQSINLGYEPQWVLAKRTNITGDWWLVDNMRGMPVGSVDATLKPNAVDAEQNVYEFINPEATGFRWQSGSISSSGQTWIYIAIRRGPMKTPTSGTQAYTNLIRTGNGTSATLTGFGFPPDAVLSSVRNDAWGSSWNDKLRNATSDTYAASAETSNSSDVINVYGQNGITLGSHSTVNTSGKNYVHNVFRRAPGFFDVVAYTATGSNGLIVNHNLGVVPELTILKSRTGARNWEINFDFTSTQCKRLQFTAAGASTGNYGTSGISHYAQPTTTQLSLTGSTNAPNTNTNTENIIGYLFASCPGVSKFGSYTGTGTTLQIDCGFTAGARFVMIKCTDSDNSPQNWYVWDSARGIIAGNDPYLLLNSSAAEVTNTDYIDSYSAGFEISSTAPIQINALNGTYIFLAIA